MKTDLFNEPEHIATRNGLLWREILMTLMAENRPFRFQARGESMHPFILQGDTVTVAPISKQIPRVGEVVAYVHPESDRFLLHRVIGRKRGGCLIQGDNLFGLDGCIPGERIWGRVSGVERGGRPVFWAGGKTGKIIALLQRAGLLRWLVNGFPRVLAHLLRRW
jgi:hypothetical protein